MLSLVRPLGFQLTEPPMREKIFKEELQVIYIHTTLLVSRKHPEELKN